MALPQRYLEKDFYTEDEYLRLEAEAPYKAEYAHGEIVSMAGGTDDHAAITFNISVALGIALRGQDCRGLSSDMKVLTPRRNFRYPDVTVVCGPRRYHGPGRSIIINPLVIVEVLSDSTATIDQGEKLHEYQAIESLQSYLLISQETARVEQYARKDEGHWDYQAVEGLVGVITIPALGINLALADIYEGIDFMTEKQSEA